MILSLKIWTRDPPPPKAKTETVNEVEITGYKILKQFIVSVTQ